MNQAGYAPFYPVLHGALSLHIPVPVITYLLVLLVSPGPAPIDQVSLIGILIVVLIEVVEHIALVVLYSLAVEGG
ncbi:MAG: hypothetical protein DLM72_07390 [Candidatus Nitrosopolaris wilkensis]|nr:MAG: hypothetical protein DLM72_07390 [Candidatus Nitrosopolaris wilkensis]